ncbi:hypothetical protein DSO57_1020598 [Entomophthora muscae]|uniref:Uncharacterized protein n=1 Tax=Entomophthora muscae TaxID=34485 RepID=A0ACC2UDC0_9FUNG|nr:hypothetical protein DSO57_1020598 [Entomophthora muscae]
MQTPALLKQALIYCYPGTLQPREKPKWNNPINVPNVLPDGLPQAPDEHVEPPSGANHISDKAEKCLHCVIVEDAHIVQTRSQARAKGKAQAVVSKPYARQLLDKAPDEGPGPSTDTSCLEESCVVAS